MQRITFFFIVIGVKRMLAQSLMPDVTASAGGFSTTTQGNISWTLGEAVSDTYDGQTIITKGFHQPARISLNSIDNAGSTGGVYTYPNPVQDMLLVDFGNMKPGIYDLTFFDELGKLLLSKKVCVQSTLQVETLDLTQFSNGVYFLKVTSAELISPKLFKISKQK
jgi:hypothetical protein